MKLLFLCFFFCFVVHFVCASKPNEHLKAMPDEKPEIETIGVRSETELSEATASSRSFEQITDYHYYKARSPKTSKKVSTTSSEPEGCLQPKDDLCHLHNGNCSACLAIQVCKTHHFSRVNFISGCGYCNDARQCLPSKGDGPAVLGCVCEVWLNEPRQCIEDVCAEVGGCKECSKKPYCVWCSEEQLCMPGGFFGVTYNPNVKCKEWRWLRCSGFSGNQVIIIAASTFAGIVVLFTILCIIYHKCYNPVRRSSSMHDELVESLLEDERTLLSGDLVDHPIIEPELDLRGDNKDLDSLIDSSLAESSIETAEKQSNDFASLLEEDESKE